MSKRSSIDAWVQYLLADGSPVVAPVYRGTVQIGPFGPFRTVITVLGDEALVGRRLMERFTVTLACGDRVIVDP